MMDDPNATPDGPAFKIATGDPCFDPKGRVVINGYSYIPEPVGAQRHGGGMTAEPEHGPEEWVVDAGYLVWSNEHRAWWQPGKAGYTLDLNQAGRYSRDEEIRIAAMARYGWQPGEPPPEIALPARDAIDALAPNIERVRR